LNKDMQKRIVSILSTALAAWTATKLAGMFWTSPRSVGRKTILKKLLCKAHFRFWPLLWPPA